MRPACLEAFKWKTLKNTAGLGDSRRLGGSVFYMPGLQALRHSWAVARDQLGARAATAVAADEARQKLDADLEMQRIM